MSRKKGEYNGVVWDFFFVEKIVYSFSAKCQETRERETTAPNVLADMPSTHRRAPRDTRRESRLDSDNHTTYVIHVDVDVDACLKKVQGLLCC